MSNDNIKPGDCLVVTFHDYFIVKYLSLPEGMVHIADCIDLPVGEKLIVLELIPLDEKYINIKVIHPKTNQIGYTTFFSSAFLYKI